MDTILLLVDHPRNRHLLREWLETRYNIIEIVPPMELPHECDLTIIDGMGLDHLGAEIFMRKVKAQPVYMPVLFMTNRKDVTMVTRHLWRSIDDLIWTPIEKVELLARVEVMLRARRLSLELQKANELKLNFLAMISHELRTPLTSIRGFASTLLIEDVDWGEEQEKDFLNTINFEAVKMEELISQLLDLSSLQAGTLAVKPQPANVADILDAAQAEVRILTANHRLNVQPTEPLPLVMADQRRIGQVLTNIIGNACKFAPEGSTITVQAEQQYSLVHFKVSDQGPGIPVDQRDVIFEAFRQIDKSSNLRGAGLGLAIAKHIVEAHGGTIWVSEKRPGTEMIFTLPVADEDQPPPDDA